MLAGCRIASELSWTHQSPRGWRTIPSRHWPSFRACGRNRLPKISPTIRSSRLMPNRTDRFRQTVIVTPPLVCQWRSAAGRRRCTKGSWTCLGGKNGFDAKLLLHALVRVRKLQSLSATCNISTATPATIVRQYSRFMFLWRGTIPSWSTWLRVETEVGLGNCSFYCFMS